MPLEDLKAHTPTEDESNKEQEKKLPIDGYDEKIAQKGRDALNGGKTTSTEEPEDDSKSTEGKPEWLPEQFWNAETGEPNVSMDELEKFFNKEQEDDEEKSKETDEDDTEGKDDKSTEGEDDSESSQVIDDIASKYAENGELSSEDYTQLEQVGISKERVDTFIEGQLAMAKVQELEVDLQKMKAFSITGGSEAGYQKMMEWMSAELPKEDLEIYNEDLNNPNRFTRTIQGAWDAYSKSEAFEANLLNGGGGQTALLMFNTKQELQEAMRSDKYKTDPSYQKEVAIAIQRSRKAGKNIFR